jgi:hypothetical protein
MYPRYRCLCLQDKCNVNNIRHIIKTNRSDIGSYCLEPCKVTTALGIPKRPVLDSVLVSIPACHAGDWGSIVRMTSVYKTTPRIDVWTTFSVPALRQCASIWEWQVTMSGTVARHLNVFATEEGSDRITKYVHWNWVITEKISLTHTRRAGNICPERVNDHIRVTLTISTSYLTIWTSHLLFRIFTHYIDYLLMFTCA